MATKYKILIAVVITILVCIGVSAILSTTIFLAINPGKNFADARNAQRSSDIQDIKTAIDAYLLEDATAVIDKLGDIPECATGAKHIGTGSGNANIGKILIGVYLPSMPKDPNDGTEADSGYTICKTTGLRFEIGAPNAENGKTLNITTNYAGL